MKLRRRVCVAGYAGAAAFPSLEHLQATNSSLKRRARQNEAHQGSDFTLGGRARRGRRSPAARSALRTWRGGVAVLLRLLCFTSQRGVVLWKVYRGQGDPRVAGGEESAAGCSASSRGKAGAALGSSGGGGVASWGAGGRGRQLKKAAGIWACALQKGSRRGSRAQRGENGSRQQLCVIPGPGGEASRRLQVCGQLSGGSAGSRSVHGQRPDERGQVARPECERPSRRGRRTRLVGPGGQTLREGRALVGWGSGADKRGRLVRENAGERAWVVRAGRARGGAGRWARRDGER